MLEHWLGARQEIFLAWLTTVVHFLIFKWHFWAFSLPYDDAFSERWFFLLSARIHEMRLVEVFVLDVYPDRHLLFQVDTHLLWNVRSISFRFGFFRRRRLSWDAVWGDAFTDHISCVDRCLPTSRVKLAASYDIRRLLFFHSFTAILNKDVDIRVHILAALRRQVDAFSPSW